VVFNTPECRSRSNAGSDCPSPGRKVPVEFEPYHNWQHGDMRDGRLASISRSKLQVDRDGKRVTRSEGWSRVFRGVIGESVS